MKNELLKFSKIYLFLLTIILVSCSEDTDFDQTPLSSKGSLIGSVKLFNKYEVENSNFEDLKIKLIDSLNIVRLVDINSDGTFRIDSISYGNYLLKIDKTGYGIIDTLGFNLQKKIETLTTIRLVENLPFEYNSFSIYYQNEMIHYKRSTIFETNDSYMVGMLICFGKDPSVSLNNCNFYINIGSYQTVNTINWLKNSSQTFALESFTNNGLQIGAEVYAVCYPVIKSSLYNKGYYNFEILSYKIGNPSNISSFILQE